MRLLVSLFLTATLLFNPALAEQPEPILIADISAYSVGASFAAPVKQALDLAEEEINAAGGILGRPVRVLHEDDMGKPASALRVLERLVASDGVKIVTGCPLANVAKAISSYAKRNQIIYALSCVESDDLLYKEAHPYFVQVAGPTIWGFNRMLAERAAQHDKTKWVAISHNYEWGQTNLAAFKDNLAEFQPNAVWVDEHWPAVGKINAGAIVQAILQKDPDAIYSPLWGSDMVEFIREGKKRGLFENRLFIADVVTRPEFLEQIGVEVPEGAIGMAILPDLLPNPLLQSFAKKFKKHYGKAPRYTGTMAYHSLYVIKAAIEKAGSENPKILASTFPGLETETIFGKTKIRTLDNVSTSGVWIGETAIKDGQAVVVNGTYNSGEKYLPTPEKIKKFQED